MWPGYFQTITKGGIAIIRPQLSSPTHTAVVPFSQTLFFSIWTAQLFTAEATQLYCVHGGRESQSWEKKH